MQANRIATNDCARAPRDRESLRRARVDRNKLLNRLGTMPIRVAPRSDAMWRYPRTVHRGRLQYQNTSLDITFDEALRRKLLATLAAIQVCADLADVRRSHPSPARCRGCAFHIQATQSLPRCCLPPQPPINQPSPLPPAPTP